VCFQPLCDNWYLIAISLKIVAAKILFQRRTRMTAGDEFLSSNEISVGSLVTNLLAIKTYLLGNFGTIFKISTGLRF